MVFFTPKYTLPKYHDCEKVTEYFGDIYLGVKKTITTYLFFIIENIRVYCQMDAA